MKLAAAIAVAATVALPVANAAEQQRVLGIDTTVLGTRLAWYDPATLTRLPGRSVSLANRNGNWSLSPNGARIALGSGGGGDYLRFVDVRRMHVLGDVSLGTGVGPGHVTWVSARRLLATGPNVVAVVDSQRLRVVRRRNLPGVVYGGARVSDGLALLLGQDVNGFAPAKVAVVDAEGRSRAVGLDRISIGFHRVGDRFEVREPGFTIDALTRRAFVVGADYTVAVVDLRTLAVSYHGGAARSLAKEFAGPIRNARWLGNGLLAVAGMDTLQRDGLRIIDTRDWSVRVADAESVNLTLAGGVLVGSAPFVPAGFAVYGMDGALRYRFELERGAGFRISGRYGYVCNGVSLARVVDLASGATLHQVEGTAAPVCVTVLNGVSADSAR
jgi:hypothetical protein